MSSVILRRRPDGILQIRPRPVWRAIAGPVPAVLLALLLGCSLILVLLATALVQFPALVLLVGGCAALALAAVRFGLSGPAMEEIPVERRPPGDAA